MLFGLRDHISLVQRTFQGISKNVRFLSKLVRRYPDFYDSRRHIYRRNEGNSFGYSPCRVCVGVRH